ncbi:alpha/beta fold hydrolase [Nocardioides limicola]|uniref:alpha/beta fold hydrolase n=1 Tax=Nocardioides limicola TaxID=2803368 RepID=UPI00193C32DA|nr:alpha/beta hydrolase [Nocardioides sp. DJM-14]
MGPRSDREQRYRDAERRWWAHVGVEPMERRVHLPALDVDVRVQEVGVGEPVLFVHGGPNSGSTWMELVSRLSGLRCLVVDRPGTGLSDPLRRPVDRQNLAEYGETLAVDVLDALDVDRAHLVVSSFGGYVGIRSAAAHPQRFDRMVQMACPAFTPEMRTPPFMRLIMTPGLGALINRLPPNTTAARQVLRQIGHGASLDAGRISPEFIDWYVALQRDTDTMAHEVRMISGLGGPLGFDRAITIPDSVLAAVQAPTRFLWGADDTFGAEATARRTVAAMPHAEVEMLPEAGHLPWIDDPERAAKVVLAHLVG